MVPVGIFLEVLSTNKSLVLTKFGEDDNLDLNLVCPRLPPLQTDQNQSILGKNDHVDENANVLLPFIRPLKMQVRAATIVAGADPRS